MLKIEFSPWINKVCGEPCVRMVEITEVKIKREILEVLGH